MIIHTDTPTAPGDRGHIPHDSISTYEGLNSEMQRIKSLAPSKYQKEVEGAEKRLGLLFDGLNNDDIKAEQAVQLKTLASSIQARDFEQAQAIHADLTKQGQTGPWMVSATSRVLLRRC